MIRTNSHVAPKKRRNARGNSNQAEAFCAELCYLKSTKAQRAKEEGGDCAGERDRLARRRGHPRAAGLPVSDQRSGEYVRSRRGWQAPDAAGKKAKKLRPPGWQETAAFWFCKMARLTARAQPDCRSARPSGCCTARRSRPRHAPRCRRPQAPRQGPCWAACRSTPRRCRRGSRARSPRPW